MATIQLKRSAVPSKVPTTTDLSLGEIAINTYDGNMYIKKDDGAESIIEIANADLSNAATGSTGVLASTGTGVVHRTIKGDLGAISVTNGDGSAGNPTVNFTASAVDITTLGGSATYLVPDQTGNSGKYLTTNGSSASWASPSSSPSINPLGPIVVESDFIESWMYNTNGYPNNSLIGGFYANATNSSFPIEHFGGEANHPGIVRFTSGNANMQLVYGYGGYSTSSSGVFPFVTGTNCDRFSIIMRRSMTASTGFFGFMDGQSASPNNSIGVRLSGSTVVCRCSNGGTATESTFTSGIAGNTWIKMDVIRNGNNFDFYRNGTKVQTITTNIPTSNKMFFGVYITNASTGNIDFDYIGMQTTALTRY